MPFRVCILLTAILSCFVCFCQKQIDILSKDGFVLKGRVWEQESVYPMILLLHQCDSDQSMYLNLAELLYERGFQVITFDYRGIGESVNKDFNLIDSENKREFWTSIRKWEHDDLSAVMNYLLERYQEFTSFSLVAASCGGPKLVHILENFDLEIGAICILSSRMSDLVKRKNHILEPFPALYIAAEKDRNAFETAQYGTLNSNSEFSEIIEYSGSYHGEALFRKDPKLEMRIVEWFDSVINR